MSSLLVTQLLRFCAGLLNILTCVRGIARSVSDQRLEGDGFDAWHKPCLAKDVIVVPTAALTDARHK